MNAPDQNALGIVETRGLVAAIEAADAMLKAARVRLVRVEKTVPALMSVQILGETAAVQSAVDAGQRAAERVGTVVSVHVIPRPAADTAQMQRLSGTQDSASKAPPKISRPKRRSQRASTRPATPTGTDLESMTVRQLRALARTVPGLPIRGREIARANKAQLLDALRSRGG